MRNQTQLRANQSRYSGAQPGVPRQGRALLQGIARCGRCGGWMALGYSGGGQYPVYRCADAKVEYGSATCQGVRAEAVDVVVETQLLTALAPDQVELALAALEALEQEDLALEQQWQLRRERARYEAERAQRQYHLVEPEHRLVARTLEAQWEMALRAVEQVEHEYEQWRRQPGLTLSTADREALHALSETFPTLWHAPTTTVVDRKRLLRLVIRDVLLDNRRARGQVWLQINWQTGL